jgi:shikimate 5-dehydrogenase
MKEQESVGRNVILNGATRLILIIGDPIAQVKSPEGITKTLQGQGRNAVVIPIQVTLILLLIEFLGTNNQKLPWRERRG